MKKKKKFLLKMCSAFAFIVSYRLYLLVPVSSLGWISRSDVFRKLSKYFEDELGYFRLSGE